MTGLASSTVRRRDMPRKRKASTTSALELNPGIGRYSERSGDNMSYLGEPERGAEMCDRSFGQLDPEPTILVRCRLL